MNDFKYTPDHIEFLKVAYKKHPLNETTELFNKKFNLEKTASQIKSCLKNKKIKSGRSGQFAKGSTSWNKGMKGYCAGGRSHETRFKKGNTPQNKRPLGSTRICSKNGYMLVKVEEKNPYTKAVTRYKHKQIIVWEEHNGPIPEKHNIRFLDGDVLNCDIDNLALISNALHVHLNRYGYNDLPPELKESALALCRLEVAYFEAKRKTLKK